MQKLKQVTDVIFRYQAKCCLLLATCCLLLASCKREKTTWDDNLVAPLATGNLNLGNLFPDTVIKTNSDSSLVISLNTNLINFQIDSLIKIPDTTTFIKDTLGVNIMPPNSPLTITPTEELFTVVAGTAAAENSYYLPNGIQLRKAIIKQGIVQIKMENTVRQPVAYHYQLLSATKNNHVLDTTFYIPGGSSVSGSLNNPGILTATLNLAGYTIDFTGSLGNQTNTLIETYTISIANYAQPLDTIFYRQGFTSYFTFKGMTPQYAVGYFGNQTITAGPDTTSFNVFNSIKKGILNLNSANVSLTVNNQFGVEMVATISNISSINLNNPSTVTLTPIGTVDVHAAHDNNGPNNPVVSVSTSPKVISLNSGNSNVAAFIGNLPGRLSYKLNAQINPLGNQSGNNDFAYYGTSFSAALNMNVPLYFSASNLMLADTVSINLAGVNQLQNINKGNLILTATNSYPFSINLTATLLDANKQSLGSLITSPGLIQVPPLDANGKVTSPLQSKLYIPLTPQKISALQKAKYVSYTATFNTANQPNQVKFYSNYTLGLLLTADVNYTVGK